MVVKAKAAVSANNDERPPAKQARSRRTRERLVKAGLILLDERDFDGIAISEFAAAAKASVGAFYHHFADKDDFYGAVIAQGLADEQARVDVAFNAPSIEKMGTQAFIGLVIEIQRQSMLTMRGLVRTALRRSLAAGSSESAGSQWTPLRQFARDYVDRVGRMLSRRTDITRHANWERRYNEAMQMAISTLFNAIINQPRTVAINDQRIVAMLTEMTIRHLGIDHADGT
jgi:AcrR family transcriptional regulator